MRSPHYLAESRVVVVLATLCYPQLAAGANPSAGVAIDDGAASGERVEPTAVKPSAEAPWLLLPVAGPEAASQAFEAELARALRARLGEAGVVTMAEINVSLSAERTKDLIGCTDVACFAEILGALGGRFALAVTLVEGEPLAQVAAILRDLTDASRAFRVERHTPSLMPARLRDLADDIAAGLLQSAGMQAVPIPQANGDASGGSLNIQTLPSGARLFLNSEEIGRSPVELSGLASGRYTVSAGAVGYHSHAQSIELSPGEQRNLDLDLDLLRHWAVGVTFPIGFYSIHLRDPLGQPTDGYVDSVGVGALYQHEIAGPLAAGGYAGYHKLSYQAYNPQQETQEIASHRGVVVGADLSVGGALRASHLIGLSVPDETDREREQREENLQAIEEANLDWPLISVRARAGLTFRSPGLVTAHVGGEIGMLGLIHVQIAWSPLLFADETLLESAGWSVEEIGLSGMAFFVTLGPSFYFPSPKLEK